MYDSLMKKDYIYSGKLGTHISDFIAEKRTFGCLYNTEAKKLSEFSRMTLNYDFPDDTLTQEVVEAWLTRRPTDADKTLYIRFGVIKGFADYMVRHGHEAFVPLSSDLPKLHTQGYVPYVFTHEEIQRFFEVYSEKTDYHCAYDERFRTMMRMIFEILYCCGLRMSEATGLTNADVDLENGILTVRFAKFEKSRYVPMSSDVVADLKTYMDSNTHEPFLFPGRTGQQLGQKSVYSEFRRVLLAAGIPHYGRGKGPRVHDFRHTFAVTAMNHLSDEGYDLYVSLPILSAYLGHAGIQSTERYVRLTEDRLSTVTDSIQLNLPNIFPEVKEDEEI